MLADIATEAPPNQVRMRNLMNRHGIRLKSSQHRHIARLWLRRPDSVFDRTVNRVILQLVEQGHMKMPTDYKAYLVNLIAEARRLRNGS